MLDTGWREKSWAALDGPWDVIIIGGGITGAGILRETTRAGLRSVLFEAHDFASGTSSRSSKLVHGGFRYLRNAQIKLTYESVHERERLLKEARGLVNPLGCLLANYRGDELPGWVFGLGLSFYDILALQWGHRHLDSPGMQSLCPSLCDTNLTGGYRYFDAQTDDARLVFRLIQESIHDGGVALNYTPVVDFSYHGLVRKSSTSYPDKPTTSSAIAGVVVCYTNADNKIEFREILAPVIINATGVWADDLRKWTGGQPCLRRLRGSHLVLPARRLPLNRALNVFHPQDGRPVFAYVWEGVTIVGTTDVDHTRELETDPQISQSEIDYLMTFLQTAFPGQEIQRSDIQATYSGIRPVLNTGKADPSKESREHIILMDNGLLSVTGGKLTTFRLMARQALNRILKLLPESYANRSNHRIFNSLDQEATQNTSSLFPPTRLRFLGRYGNPVSDLLKAAGPGEFETINETVATWAELRWAARSEAAVHLDDILLRRVRIGLLTPLDQLLSKMDKIRSIVQPEMKWDDLTWDTELERYINLWRKSYSIP